MTRRSYIRQGLPWPVCGSMSCLCLGSSLEASPRLGLAVWLGGVGVGGTALTTYLLPRGPRGLMRDWEID